MVQLLKEVFVMSATTNKKLYKLLTLATVSLVSLTSCSSTNKDLPSDAAEAIITVNGNEISLDDIYFNDKENYYGNLSGFNEKTMDKLLLEVAKAKVGDGTTLTGYTALTSAEIREEAEKVMLKKVNTNTYDVNYYFDEEAFVKSLQKDMYPVDTSTCDYDHKVIITNNSTYDEVFTCGYDKYIEQEIVPDIIRNQLVTEYLYEDSYTSIGVTNARDFDIVKISDGKNANVGDALLFVNAFLDDLQNEEIQDKSTLTLRMLAEARKGNKEYAGVSDFYSRHTDLEKHTLVAYADQDMEKIATKDEDHYTPLPENEIDKDLFSEYTGSSTYSLDVGYERKLGSITQEKNYISGMYLSSSTIDGVPDSIKNRIFSSNYNTDPESTAKDVTTMIGGYRFLTTENGQGSTSGDRNVIFYDSSTTSYYLVIINEVVNTGVLAKNDADSEEVKAKKKDLVKEISYLMVDNSTYRTDSTVYFLKDLDIEYNNETFFEYMQTTYPALFEEDTYEE